MWPWRDGTGIISRTGNDWGSEKQRRNSGFVEKIGPYRILNLFPAILTIRA